MFKFNKKDDKTTSSEQNKHSKGGLNISFFYNIVKIPPSIFSKVADYEPRTLLMENFQNFWNNYSLKSREQLLLLEFSVESFLLNCLP